MNILNQYNVYMFKSSTGKKRIECKNIISSYLYSWKDKDEINGFLKDIDLALNGKYQLIEEPNYDDGLLQLYGLIMPNDLKISGGIPDPLIVPLLDFKALLTIWRDF